MFQVDPKFYEATNSTGLKCLNSLTCSAWLLPAHAEKLTFVACRNSDRRSWPVQMPGAVLLWNPTNCEDNKYMYIYIYTNGYGWIVKKKTLQRKIRFQNKSSAQEKTCQGWDRSSCPSNLMHTYNTYKKIPCIMDEWYSNAAFVRALEKRPCCWSLALNQMMIFRWCQRCPFRPRLSVSEFRLILAAVPCEQHTNFWPTTALSPLGE